MASRASGPAKQPAAATSPRDRVEAWAAHEEKQNEGQQSATLEIYVLNLLGSAEIIALLIIVSSVMGGMHEKWADLVRGILMFTGTVGVAHGIRKHYISIELATAIITAWSKFMPILRTALICFSIFTTKDTVSITQLTLAILGPALQCVIFPVFRSFKEMMMWRIPLVLVLICCWCRTPITHPDKQLDYKSLEM